MVYGEWGVTRYGHKIYLSCIGLKNFMQDLLIPE